MKWLKSLVFVVFLMGVGVVVERVSIALYERGSKVDWEVIKKALLADQDGKRQVAIDSVATDAAASKTDEAAPSRPARHGRATAAASFESKRENVDAKETPVLKFPNWTSSDTTTKRFEERSARTNTPPTLAIRPLKRDDAIAITPPLNPPVIDEVTAAVRPAEPADLVPTPADIAPTPARAEPTAAVVMPGPVVSGPTPTFATPGPVGPGPTPAVRVPVPAVVAPEPIATPSEPAPAVAPPAIVPMQPAAADGERVHVVYHLRSVPASNIANSLRAIFPKKNSDYTPQPPDEILIEPESVSNSLLISGLKAKVEEALRLAKEMDHPAAMVRLEVRISEVDPAKVKKADEAAPEKDKAADEGAKGDLFVAKASEEGTPLARAVVATLANQPAQIFMGRMEPQIGGVARGPAGATKMVNSVSLGTQINMTPRLDHDKTVSLQIKVEDSRSGPEEEGIVVSEPKDEQPIRMPRTEQFHTDTTVRLEDGKTMLLGGMSRDGKSGKMRLISVTAHIVPVGEGK